MEKSSMILYGITFNVTYKRMKNLRMRIEPDLTVSVSVPLKTTNAAIEDFVTKNISWIETQISSMKNKNATQPNSGDTIEFFYLLGKKIPVTYRTGSGSFIQLLDDVMVVETPSKPDKQAIIHGIKSIQRKYFSTILPSIFAECEELTKVHPSKWTIRDMTTRWGSCNVKTNSISIRLDLVSYPYECIKAVVIHELTHIHEPSHNKRFYELMNSFYPENAEPNAILDKHLYRWY